MMNVLCTLPAVMSALILGAHFLRSDWIVIAAICTLAPLLLLTGKTWAIRIVQLLLTVGVFIWIDAGLSIYKERLALGMPWLRMALIIGAVGLASLGSAVLLERQLSREHTPGDGTSDPTIP